MAEISLTLTSADKRAIYKHLLNDLLKHVPSVTIAVAALLYLVGFTRRSTYLEFFGLDGAIGIDPYSAMISGLIPALLGLLFALSVLALIFKISASARIPGRPIDNHALILVACLEAFAAGGVAMGYVDACVQIWAPRESVEYQFRDKIVVGTPLAADENRVAVRTGKAVFVVIPWGEVTRVRRLR